MSCKFKIFVLFLSIFFTQIEIYSAENILVVAFFGSKSHKNVYDPLFKALSLKGHKLTIIHPVKSDYNDTNILEINGVSLDEIMEKEYENVTNRPNIFDLRMENLHLRTPINSIITPNILRGCREYYEMPQVKEILEKKFALVILASHKNECTYGLMHKLKTSSIFVHPHALEHYKSSFSGLQSPSSFVPSYTIGATTDRMGFLDRAYNFLAYGATSFLYEFYYAPRMEALYREFVGQDAPSIKEIGGNVSLALHNAHFSLTYPRPQLPQIVDVAGMHCRDGTKLPKDLQDFLDSSGPSGFILFSLGSHVKASEMPEKIKEELIKGFSQLKEKVLWKWDSDGMEGVGGNVKVVSWVPQQDVLAHPKIRAFITHGGLLSTQEAAYHGVPLIGIPLFGDQISCLSMIGEHDWNMKQAEANGFALTLELKDLTSQLIVESVRKITTEAKYTKAAKTLGSIFRDRPQKALESAIFWTEYVMRHKGAVHLKSSAVELNFWQYHSLDVIAFLSAILCIGIYFFNFIMSSIFLLYSWRKNSKTVSNKVKKQ